MKELIGRISTIFDTLRDVDIKKIKHHNFYMKRKYFSFIAYFWQKGRTRFYLFRKHYYSDTYMHVALIYEPSALLVEMRYTMSEQRTS